MNGQLLYNVTQQLKTLANKSQVTTANLIPIMNYVLNADNLPLVNNQVNVTLSTQWINDFYFS